MDPQCGETNGHREKTLKRCLFSLANKLENRWLSGPKPFDNLCSALVKDYHGGKKSTQSPLLHCPHGCGVGCWCPWRLSRKFPLPLLANSNASPVLSNQPGVWGAGSWRTGFTKISKCSNTFWKTSY